MRVHKSRCFVSCEEPYSVMTHLPSFASVLLVVLRLSHVSKGDCRVSLSLFLRPATFASANHVTEETIPSDMLPPSDEDSDDEEPDLMMVNPNRRQVEFEESSTDEDSDNT